MGVDGSNEPSPDLDIAPPALNIFDQIQNIQSQNIQVQDGPTFGINEEDQIPHQEIPIV